MLALIVFLNDRLDHMAMWWRSNVTVLFLVSWKCRPLVSKVSCCVLAGDHDSSLPSSATAITDDCNSHTSDTTSGDDQQQDQPVNMTCRRWSATVHTGLTTDVILPTLQHAAVPRQASVEAPRIWSVVELIQSNKDDNVKHQPTKHDWLSEMLL